MNNDYKEQYAAKIASYYQSLELRIMEDIVRRIQKTGEITSTADYQINRLQILGYSSENIEKELKKALDASYPQMFELYDKVIEKEYTRNKAVYEQINAKFIPFEENHQLQQITDAIMLNAIEDLQNISGSLGFYLDYGNGKRVITPLAEIYQGYLDNACMDIVTGAFDYNTVLRKVVSQLTNSGLRVIDYASGWHNRVEVAARRAVMTGVSQVTGRIAEYNAASMGTEYFEVAWHAGARPTHAVWQGKVWSEEELYSVCGLGTVTGLLGANCYHEYYPFFPGISERNWTDEWLEQKNLEESTPKTFKGKEYTVYQAKQRQRQMETAMRAQREKVQLLKKAGADRDEITLQKAKYQGQLDEYAQFSRKMGLKQERERIYMDGRGRIAPGQTAYTERGGTNKRGLKEEIALNQHKGTKIKITSQAIEKVKLVNIKGNSNRNNILMQKIHKELLQFAKEENNSNEVATLINLNNSDRTSFVKGNRHEVDIYSNAEIYHLLMTAEKQSLTLCHNHPGATDFSANDISVFMRHNTIKTMTIVTNKGKVKSISKDDKFQLAEASKLMKKCMIENNNNLEKGIEDFLKKCYSIGVIRQ